MEELILHESLPFPQPEVYADEREALPRAHEFFAKYGRIYRLPYWTSFGNFLSKGQFEREIFRGGEHSSEDKFPVGFSKMFFTEEARTIPVVLLSEEPVNPIEPYEGLKPFYRYGTIDDLRLILKYGFYQLPMREAFFHKPDTLLWKNKSDTTIAFAMNLESSQVNNGRLETVSLSLPSVGKFNMNILPDEIRDSLGEINVDPSEGTVSKAEERKVLRGQVLQLGADSGFLLHIPPGRLNREETLRVNVQYQKEDRISEKALEEVKNILES